jgi:murein DD-endopeptidase
MVNVALEPPNSAPHRTSRRFPRILAVALIVLASAAGGFAIGRRGLGRARVETPESAVRVPFDGPATATTAPSGGSSPPTTAPPALPATPPPVGAGEPRRAVQPASPPTLAPEADGSSTSAGEGWKRLAMVLNGPVVQSVTAALSPEDRGRAEELTQMVNRILVWHLRVSRESRKGDRLEVLYAPPSGDRQELVIQAVRYRSLQPRRTFEALRYQPDGSAFARYYQPDGSEVEERLRDGPVADYEQVTSLLNDGRRHQGVDFKTPVGSPVTSPFDGVVVRRNWHFSANGNCLEILDGASGRHAIFLHLESVPKELQPGAQVRRGQLVARSGNSGHSTAPHLHYQLESSDGRILDPFAVHQKYRVSLQGAARTRFDEVRAKLEGLLTGSEKG